jgi:cytochrome P450
MHLMEKLKDSLEAMERAGAFHLEHVEADAMQLIEQIKEHTAEYPEPVFAVLRRLKPVLIVKGVALITKFDDVQDVLTRDDVFQVTYGPKMRVVTGGADFFLGMQSSPEYERDVSHMRSVMRRSDVSEIIVPFVGKTAKELVDAAPGSIDVVNGLGLVVPTRLIEAYYGYPVESEADLAKWASKIFQYLFTDLTNDPVVDAEVRVAAAHVREWLDAGVKAAKAAGSKDDTVLNRCLALQAAGLPAMDDVGIRNNLLGILTGCIPTTSKCCSQALDQLLQRPEALAAAQEAARADDDVTLAQYVLEALRFHPNNPGVFRVAAEDYVVGKGHPHATTVTKGTSVLAATQSAMFDECKVEKASEFMIGRPSYNSMMWGVGLHTCFGQYINQVQIPGILKPLLQKRNLRRADGVAGTLQRSGPFPSSLVVEFD